MHDVGTGQNELEGWCFASLALRLIFVAMKNSDFWLAVIIQTALYWWKIKIKRENASRFSLQSSKMPVINFRRIKSSVGRIWRYFTRINVILPFLFCKQSCGRSPSLIRSDVSLADIRRNTSRFRSDDLLHTFSNKRW